MKRMRPRSRHRNLAPVLVLGFVLPASGFANEFAAAEATATKQGRTALESSSAAITEADLRRYVTRLASTEYEGRGTGDKGERMATAYLATFFEGLGLQPEGEDGSYYQTFTFRSGMKLEGRNSLTLQLDEPLGLVRRFSPGEHYQPLSLSSTATLDAEVVFAGFGIESEDYDSFAGLEVEGKWVVVFRGNPVEQKKLTRFGPLVAKATIAKKKKAAGIIYVKGTNPAISRELMPPHIGVGGRDQILPAVTITDRLAAALLTGKGDLDRLKSLFEKYNTGKRISGFPLPYSIAAEIGISAKEESGRNVIARLVVGETPSAEAIIIGGHIDHLGYGNRGGTRAKGEEASKIHFGADDNASGVAAIMELAQFFADQKKAGGLALRRDLIFAGWSGEEMGLHGSRRYVNRAREVAGKDAPLHPEIAAYINLDMVGRAKKGGLQVMGTGSSAAWPPLLDGLPEVPGLAVKRSESPYIPTDTASFYGAGIPILAAFTGLHDDYHTPRDTIETIDFPGLNKVTSYLQHLTTALASHSEAPGYIKVERKGRRGSPRVRIGIRPEEQEGGLVLAQVEQASPAGEAGLQQGDFLRELDGVKIKNLDDLGRALGKAEGRTGIPVRRSAGRRNGGGEAHTREAIRSPRPGVFMVCARDHSSSTCRSPPSFFPRVRRQTSFTFPRSTRRSRARSTWPSRETPYWWDRASTGDGFAWHPL